jgi:regulator of sigma E protease
LLVIIGFICIILLVIAHEAGHFFAARRNGIEVEEFGIGFPPRAKKLGEKNGTEYTLNWLPLGGFVKLKGEHDSDTEPGTFGAARLRDKVKVMVAGVVVNFLIAYLLFTIVAFFGMPKLVENQFSVSSDVQVTDQKVLAAVLPDSPADQAGIKDNDDIQRIEQVSCTDECNVIEITNAEDLRGATEQFAGQEVVVTHERAGETLTTTMTFNTEAFVEQSRSEAQACIDAATGSSDDCPIPQSYFGVFPRDYIVERSTWSAPIVGAGITAQYTGLTLQGLGSIVTGLFQGDVEQATEQVSGVVGVGYIFNDASFLGPIFMMMVVGVISLSLAILNILPIPALDGGRLFVTLLYRGLRKPLTQEAEERIHGTGFAVIMVLFVLITVVDVQRFVL